MLAILTPSSHPRYDTFSRLPSSHLPWKLLIHFSLTFSLPYNIYTVHAPTHPHSPLLPPSPLILIESSHIQIQMHHTQVNPSLCSVSHSYHLPLSHPLTLCPYDRFYWPFFFSLYLLFLFGLPRPLINPTNSKGYINVDNQFLYVSSQSLEKKSEKNQNRYIQLCKCVFLTIFNVITSSNLILLPLLQLVLKHA